MSPTHRRSNTEWISVKDRLPNENQNVIFYVLERDEIFSGYFVVDSWRSENKTAKFREALDNWWFEDETITHWMPLPIPPKA